MNKERDVFSTFGALVFKFPMNKVIRTFLALVLFLAPMIAVLAQPPIGGNPPCWPPPCIPVDGGLGALIVAGILFGAKKAIGLRRDRKDID